MQNMQKYLEYIIGTVASVALLVAAKEITGWFPFTLTESLGFVSGAWTVWLTVRQNIWCWPIGIANNIFFIILFLDAKLYGDTVLQVIYIVLSVLGWYWWLHGGAERTELKVNFADRLTLLILAGIVAVSTAAMTFLLQAANGSIPFLDALTTTLSLAAQYLLSRKLMENWYIWITADVIYIGLYIYKGLYLTAALYLIFIAMCIAGIIEWRKSVAAAKETSARPPLTGQEAQAHG